MDFTLNEQQTELQRVARDFAQKEMVSVALEMEEKNIPLPKDWLKKYAEMGFLGINVGKKYGGLGLSNLEALLVIEEFAKISSAVAFPIFESCVGPVKPLNTLRMKTLR
jgi:alkylation response protein AidB-like acyl-CoA dehydrogenase